MSLASIFFNSSRNYPDNTAILYFENVDSSRKITYKELENESHKISFHDSYTHVNHPPDPEDHYTQSNSHWKTKPFQRNSSNVSSSGKLTACNNAGFYGSSSKIIVGVLCRPGPVSITCMLGIMENNAYFFMSPDWTINEFRSYLLRVCPEILLIEESFVDKVSGMSVEMLKSFYIYGTKVTAFRPIYDEPPINQNIDMGEVAFVILTSGSTGPPKVVYVPHRCIIPNILDLVDIFQAVGSDCIFCASPPTFDPSLIDIFVGFKAGSCLIMASRNIIKRPRFLLDVLIKSKTTILQATPSLLFNLDKERVKGSLLGNISPLRVLALGGEMFPKLSVLKDWLGCDCNTKIFNLYGITEVSCWASITEVIVNQITEKSSRADSIVTSLQEKDNEHYVKNSMVPLQETYKRKNTLSSTADSCVEISIGDALSLTTIKVLNTSRQEVKECEKGEIFIGGYERCCWIDDSTAEAGHNIQHSVISKKINERKVNCEGTNVSEKSKQNLDVINQPLTHHKQALLVMRRTGDVGVIRNGKIYCLGRMDRQVKRNGQKVSLPEIERCCRSLDCVENCHAVVHKGSKIAAFIKLVSTRFCTVNDIWKDLKKLWSGINLPDIVIIIDAMPFNSHGKIDESKLLEMLQKPTLNELNSCDRRSIHEFVKQLWKRTLGIQHVKDNDNFIENGGNSLSAVQFYDEVENYFRIKIPSFLDVILNGTLEDIIETVVQHKYNSSVNDNSSYKNKKIKLETSYKDRNDDGKDNRLKPYILDQNQFDSENGMKRNYDDISITSRRGVLNSESTVNLEYNQTDTQLLWQYDLGKCIDSSPTIVSYISGKTLLFVGSHSHDFVCLNVKTGSKEWRLTLGNRIESSPCVSRDGKYVFIGCYDYSLYCISVSEGRIEWKFSAESEIKSSPVFDEELKCVVFGSHDKNLYCVAIDGNLRWRVHLSGGSIFSSPCIIDRQVFAATLDGIIAGVQKTSGDIDWKISVEKPVFSSVVSYSRGIVFGAVCGRIYSYSCDGDKLWEYKTNGPVFSSAFVKTLQNGLEIISIGCHDCHVYFFNNSGICIARYQGESPVYATPFIFSVDVLHILRTVICETAGKFSLVDLIFNSPSSKGISGCNSKDVGYDLRGPVSSSSKDTAGTDIFPTLYKVSEGKCNGEIFSSPVVFQKRLFICSRDDIVYCFQFRKDTTKL